MSEEEECSVNMYSPSNEQASSSRKPDGTECWNDDENKTTNRSYKPENCSYITNDEQSTSETKPNNILEDQPVPSNSDCYAINYIDLNPTISGNRKRNPSKHDTLLINVSDNGSLRSVPRDQHENEHSPAISAVPLDNCDDEHSPVNPVYSDSGSVENEPGRSKKQYRSHSESDCSPTQVCHDRNDTGYSQSLPENSDNNFYEECTSSPEHFDTSDGEYKPPIAEKNTSSDEEHGLSVHENYEPGEDQNRPSTSRDTMNDKSDGEYSPSSPENQQRDKCEIKSDTFDMHENTNYHASLTSNSYKSSSKDRGRSKAKRRKSKRRRRKSSQSRDKKKDRHKSHTRSSRKSSGERLDRHRSKRRDNTETDNRSSRDDSYRNLHKHRRHRSLDSHEIDERSSRDNSYRNSHKHKRDRSLDSHERDDRSSRDDSYRNSHKHKRDRSFDSHDRNGSRNEPRADTVECALPPGDLRAFINSRRMQGDAPTPQNNSFENPGHSSHRDKRKEPTDDREYDRQTGNKRRRHGRYGYDAGDRNWEIDRNLESDRTSRSRCSSEDDGGDRSTSQYDDRREIKVEDGDSVHESFADSTRDDDVGSHGHSPIESHPTQLLTLDSILADSTRDHDVGSHGDSPIESHPTQLLTLDSISMCSDENDDERYISQDEHDVNLNQNIRELTENVSIDVVDYKRLDLYRQENIRHWDDSTHRGWSNDNNLIPEEEACQTYDERRLSSPQQTHQNDMQNPSSDVDHEHPQYIEPAIDHGVQRNDPAVSHLDSMQLLYKLESDTPRKIILSLAESGASMNAVLMDIGDHQDVFTLLLSVFAKAVSCHSMNEHLNQAMSLISEQKFFNTASDYFTLMPPDEAHIFRKALIDMLTIVTYMTSKDLVSVMQAMGMHGILEALIDRLSKKNVIVNDEILKTFKAFSACKDKLLSRNISTVLYQNENECEEIDDDIEDFRNIGIFPNMADIEGQSCQHIRANKVVGKYENLDQYLDIQFRLLREDFVGPLRDGINEYIYSLTETGRRGRLQNVKIYHNVVVLRPICNDVGLCYLIQFDISRLKKAQLVSSKRLIFGSLICLSQDDFNTFHFATVIERNPEQLQKGRLTVRFENIHTDVPALFQSIFTMAETTAYFESYRHVLSGLQKTQDGNLPFEEYIVYCENQVEPPQYLRKTVEVKFDLRPLVDEHVILKRGVHHLFNGPKFTEVSQQAKDVAILNLESWPSGNLLHVDESQLKAIQTALTKEFAIIQGPPGTGKTYIGLKIAKALLHNRSTWKYSHEDTGPLKRPMLIVCYTNHALDQFLEGVVQFYGEGVLRVGGRSTSEVLENFKLKEVRRKFRSTMPFEFHIHKKRVKDEMDSLHATIFKKSTVVKFAQTTILHERFLKDYMGNQYERLLKDVRALMGSFPNALHSAGFSAILVWLGIGYLGTSHVKTCTGNDNFVDAEEHTIHIEGLIDFLQNQILEDEFYDVNAVPHNKARSARTEKETQLAYTETRIYRTAVTLDPELAERQLDRNDELIIEKKETIGFIKAQLERNDIAAVEEPGEFVNLFDMSTDDKWKLYRLWRQKCLDAYSVQTSFDTLRYDTATRLYREILIQEDREIMHNSTVIGMTTTGAAKYQAVLQDVQPKIIIVEEAAEVLEAHIITSLSKSCEHLILIGDHKQLKPNPTVYKLAKYYNLDISLFERMVKNNIRCDCLELQHRLRPEIADLMRHIYKNYHNHNDVEGYDNIKGISTNMFFINHREKESHDDGLISHSNDHEADFMVSLCRYLLQQGYSAKQITVLTLYSAQLFALKKRMPKPEFDGVRVTVVDNYQGEENDIVLLTLVRSNSQGKIGFLESENRICVALSRAKMGLYVIGNFDLLLEYNRTSLWKSLVEDLRQKKMIGDGLVLQCQIHPNENGCVVKRKKDFEQVQDGGCSRKCDHRLECGHVCAMFCHPLDKEHRRYKCKKVCDKRICEKGHRCKRKCDESCGPCRVLVNKTIPKCGHEQPVPCCMQPEKFVCKRECTQILDCGHRCKSVCGMPHTTQCLEKVKKKWSCEHSAEIECYRKDAAECPTPCPTMLECGHKCPGKCGLCYFDRFHMPCKEDCKRILVCGHECNGTCNQCRPCTRPCENICAHSMCKQRCGEPCYPCMEPCTWHCEHFNCSQFCGDPCDRPRCNEPCKEVLPCEHPCIGLCGEPCPPFCRICDAEIVNNIIFGDEDDPSSHFVLLEDCSAKCIIESKAMDQWMDSSGEGCEEIKLKKCPICSTTIRKSKRYGTITNKTLLSMECVKNMLLLNKTKAKGIEMQILENLDKYFQGKTKTILKQILHHMKTPKTEHALTALQNQCEILRRLQNLETKLHKQMNNDNNDEKKELLTFIDTFFKWALMTRQVMTTQELETAECELVRLEHHVKFYLHQKRIREGHLKIKKQLKLLMIQVGQILGGRGKYGVPGRGIVEDCLQELDSMTTLGIDEEERLMILKAMALPTGHWFTCQNGHVYAISHCGGAMEEANCPECDARIGGENHRLLDSNSLASEMDGAQHAAWSEQANMANYGFEERF